MKYRLKDSVFEVVLKVEQKRKHQCSGHQNDKKGDVKELEETDVGKRSSKTWNKKIIYRFRPLEPQ